MDANWRTDREREDRDEHHHRHRGAPPPSSPDRPLARRPRDRRHVRGAASLLFIEVASYLGDEAPQPTHAPEVAGVAALVALFVCLPRLSARVRAWGWSLSGVVAYLTVSTADWLADGSFLASPVLPLLAALSGGALLMAGVLLAYSGACARSSAATAG
jgi:hypothetical protein